MYFVSLKARNLFKIPAGNLVLYFFNLNTTKMPLRDVCKMCSSIYFEAVHGRSHKALLETDCSGSQAEQFLALSTQMNFCSTFT